MATKLCMLKCSCSPSYNVTCGCTVMQTSQERCLKELEREGQVRRVREVYRVGRLGGSLRRSAKQSPEYIALHASSLHKLALQQCLLADCTLRCWQLTG